MSAFLGFESYLTPLGSTIADAHTTLRAALTSRGWQIVHDSLLMQIMTTLGTFADATYTKEKAFNGISNIDSRCASTAALPLWVGCRLNIATQVVKVAIMGDIGTPTYCPKDFTIDWSDDGSAWTTALTVTNQINWGSYERRTYDITPAGAHAYWRVNVTAKNGGSYTSMNEVEFMDQYGNIATNVSTTYFDIIPPVSETIGDSRARDLLRLEFSATTIGLRPMIQTLVGATQSIALWPKTAGNVQAGFTLNGATVTQLAGTMSAGNTAIQNHRFLFDAIKASVDPLITAWDWEYQTPAAQNADDANDYIYGRCKTITYQLALTPNANTNGIVTGFPVAAGTTNFSTYLIEPAAAQTLTIDLANGFIYYLQVNARGIALSTKTNVNLFGPVHGCYGDHAKAVAGKPANAPDTSVIELIVGYDMIASNDISSRGFCSHYWTMNATTETSIQAQVSGGRTASFGGSFFRYKLQDENSNNETIMTLYGSNLWNADANAGNDFQVHRIGMQGLYTVSTNTGGMSGYGTAICPYIEINDWFKFRGTAVNEALVLVADTQSTTTLVGDIALAASPTTLNLVSTSLFNTTGFVSINDEIFQYTGISGNTLTGISRAKYGTIARNQYSGDTVCQCLWFTIINGGALLCGFNKPS